MKTTTAGSAPTSAAGDWRARARLEWEAGQKSFALSHYDEAVTHFEAAYGIDPAPAFLFNLARSHAKQYDIDGQPEHLRRAVKLYETFLGSQPDSPRRPEVLVEIDALKRRIASETATPNPTIATASAATTSTVKASTGTATSASGTATAPTGQPDLRALGTSTPVAGTTVVVSDVQGAPTAPTKTPIYRRWWLWTAVGVVLLGGTAAALGATLSQPAYPPLGVGTP